MRPKKVKSSYLDAPHEVGIAGDHPTEPDVLSGSEPEKEPSKSEKFDLTEEEEGTCLLILHFYPKKCWCFP